jgi:tetratricopeptide (TPR) repeat protein
MAEVSIEAAPQKARDLFHKGLAALERGRLEYAVEMFTESLAIEPALLTARRLLRAASIQAFRQKHKSPASRWLALGKSLTAYPQAMLLLKRGLAREAMEAADRLLFENPAHVPFLVFFADAAEAAGLPEAALQALEVAHEQAPENTSLLERLGRTFLAANETGKAVACLEKLNALKPNHPEYQRILKDMLARHTISKDGWQAASDGSGYRKMMRDTESARRLDEEKKAVRTDGDLADLIAETQRKIEAEPGNVNYRRALARLYQERGAHDDAIRVLEETVGLVSGDPEVENALADARLAKLDAEIQALREAGRQKEADDRLVERDQFLLDSLQDRVARYPNDLNLRHRLGVLMFTHGFIDEAILQLQFAQRSPKLRTSSLYHLGLCFLKKRQLDLAESQFQSALAEMTRMDEQKKQVLYALGELAEQNGARERAAEFFKQIYQVDIGYRDVAKKVENLYRSS